MFQTFKSVYFAFTCAYEHTTFRLNGLNLPSQPFDVQSSAVGVGARCETDR